MNTKNEKEETKKSLDDLENEKIDGTGILGGGTGTVVNSTDIDVEGSLENNLPGARLVPSQVKVILLT